MKETSGGWKSWAAVAGTVVALWAPAAAWIARETGSPARRAQAITAGTSGSASLVQRVRRPQLGPPGTEAGDEAVGARAPGETTARDDEPAVDVERSPGAAMEPRLEADVRPPPPPEAFWPVPPRALSSQRDLGLGFGNEPPGDGVVEAKEANPPGARDQPSGPTSPALAADLRPAPDPEAWVLLALGPTPDPDTGLVFINQPPRAIDASGEKH